MQYLSVKDVAAKFELSQRRVQQLCESGRIDGAQMISGVWVIPEHAEKPVDGRITQIQQTSDLISLQQLCEMLSISVATGRNWVKSGKLTPQQMIQRNAYFSIEYAESVKCSLKDNQNKLLKSRRNKKYVSGTNIYHSYVSENSVSQIHVQQILDCIEANHITVEKTEICALLAECAIQLLLHDTDFPVRGKCLEAYINGSLDLDGYAFLIDDLLTDKESSLQFIHDYPDLFNITYPYEAKEDVLGLLYISTKNLGSRKATGSYYTPTEVVKKLCRKLFEQNSPEGKTILDPCCGTGNFLLQLPDTIPFRNIYGNDTDELSVRITRINMAIKYSVTNRKELYEHITNEDYLNHDFTRTYDFIIGNPPWGYAYTKEEKTRLRNKYASAVGSSIESYDVFIEQAIRDLSLNGVLSFVLPEAILNVKTHMPIRRVLTQCCSFQYLNFLGNAFDKVQCPCVIFQIKYTKQPVSCIGMEVCDSKRHFKIDNTRDITADCFSFLTTDEEYSILHKIEKPEGKCFLEGNAVFALGIVTGDNKKYISSVRNDSNEMVLKGSDLRKFRFHSSENYIEFKPESFQQIAPVEYYRAPEKLLYRFICNQLVFAYDDKQTLSLNSCNLVIPQIEGLSVKYILAVLNSRVAQYYFRKKFNSVKVLRSHIEQIPIPYIPQQQQKEFIESVDTLLEAKNEHCILSTYDELDQKISSLYELSDDEYSIIQESMHNENLFLI